MPAKVEKAPSYSKKKKLPIKIKTNGDENLP